MSTAAKIHGRYKRIKFIAPQMSSVSPFLPPPSFHSFFSFHSLSPTPFSFFTHFHQRTLPVLDSRYFLVCAFKAHGFKKGPADWRAPLPGSLQQVDPIKPKAPPAPAPAPAPWLTFLPCPPARPTFSLCPPPALRAAFSRCAPGHPSGCQIQRSRCQARALRMGECLWDFSEKSGV